MKRSKNKISHFISNVGVSLVVLVGSSSADDLSKLGGDLTSDFTDRNAVQLPAPNVTEQERIDFQLSGFEPFHSVPQDRPGLGPRFNSLSCGGCHVNNGRGEVRLPGTSVGSAMIVKISQLKLKSDRSPKNIPGVGEQLQDHHISGKKLFNIRLKWRKIPGKYGDGEKFELRKPELTFTIPKYSQRNIAYSLRMTPHVIGMGLLEAISDETIIAKADPNDEDQDGISGKVQYVFDRRTGLKKIGRFGFKASHPTLEQQSAAAAFNDIGLTSSLFNDTNDAVELSDEALFRLVIYMQIAGVPHARNQEDPAVIKGQELFKQIGCSHCHTMTVQTGPSSHPELTNQTFHPFTDLLLHDMGPGLADKRAEFQATGREWRTTPLWGLGFSKNLSEVRAHFLHDGRARTVAEAILWHGGEARTSKEAFRKMPASERESLLAFLDSL